MISALFAACLLFVAIFMRSHQRDAWRKTQQESQEDEDRNLYLRQQNYRRLTVSYILMAIAVLIAGSSLVPVSLFLIGYWAIVLLLVVWIIVLAGIDVLSTSNYLLIIRDRQIVARRIMEEQARKKKESGSIQSNQKS